MNISREEAKLCVGAGWSSLIDKIYDRLPEDAYILQIKEKFGGLRFYVHTAMNIMDFVAEVEEESYTICEKCGKPGKLRENGWILTLCDECDKERKDEVV